ncbi:MAG TPA: hypothetical protein VMV10_07710 [Pirellulales bacterium]|nr:hypothetical protein [Pirellulales bacterium]
MATILSRLKPTRRWLQFSLRTMLLLMLVCGVWLGWFVDRAQRQKRAVEKIEAEGGEVGFWHRPIMPDFCGVAGGPTPGPDWLCRLIGEEYFTKAIEVRLPAERSPDSQAAALLPDLPYLKVLHIDGLQQSDQTDARRLTTLKYLVFQTSERVDLNCFISNQELEQIDLSASKTDEIDLQPLEALPKLNSLRIELKSSSSVRNVVKQISRLRKLEELALVSPNLRGDDLAPLRAMENLNYLELSGGDFNDSTLVHLQNLPRLEILDVRGAKFTSFGLSKLNKNLEFINFWDLSISDIELACFRRLPMLKSLWLGECTFTDAGLASLVGMDNLEFFIAASSHATDRGVEMVRRSMKYNFHIEVR